MMENEKLVVVTCPECEGEGGWEQITGITYRGDVWSKLVMCPVCDGTGEIEVTRMDEEE